MNGRGRQSGQSMVEFALVIPIFLLFLLGLIEMGRAVYTWNAISQGAREGARLAAVEAGWIGKSGTNCTIPPPDLNPAPASGCPADATTDLPDRVRKAVNRMTVALNPIPVAGISVTCSPSPCSSSTTAGDVVTVTVNYDSTTLTPIIGNLIRTYHMSATAKMVVN
jgi:Flp pilus assembly protein TadG